MISGTEHWDRNAETSLCQSQSDRDRQTETDDSWTLQFTQLGSAQHHQEEDDEHHDEHGDDHELALEAGPVEHVLDLPLCRC